MMLIHKRLKKVPDTCKVLCINVSFIIKPFSLIVLIVV